MDWLENISPEQAGELLRKGKVVVVDVREVAEFEDAHIPGALLHPLSEFDATALPCDPSCPVLFHCAGGKRSAMAAEHYRATTGCETVAHIEGGITAWIECGLPIKTSDGTEAGA